MLIQFSLRNFKTFKEKATLSLVASNYDKETREFENVVVQDAFGLRLLKSAVIYGANASGKSKLIEALMFMRDFVINSSRESQKGDEIAVESFQLNTENENEPSEFEVLFLLNGAMYRYGFEVDKSKVVSEWLFFKPKTKEIELFFREFQEFETHPRNFQKGGTLVKDDFVRDNALLLSVAAQFNEETATMLLSWFQDLNVISGLDESKFKTTTISKVRDATQKNKILNLLKKADLGIQDINLKEYLEEPTNERLDKALGDVKKIVKKLIGTEAFSYIETIHNKYDHEGRRAGSVNFSMDAEESKGTQKFFYLTGPIIDALENGHIMVVDELDSKIHPNLVCKLISLFNSKELNPKNAQLIFNTHDTNLLSSGLFRRDQIWFTEKNKFGEARLYSLADFKAVRKVEAFEENYIRGKYGAVPFLGDFDNLLNVKLFLQYEDEKQGS